MANNINIFNKIDKMLEYAVSHYNSGKSNSGLPQEHKDLFERWTVAYQTAKDYNARGNDYIQSTYSAWLFSRFGIDNIMTVREDLYAGRLFGVRLEPLNFQFKRLLQIERLEKMIYKCEIAGEYGNAAKLEAVLQKHLDKKNDPVELLDHQEVSNNFQIIQAHNPELLGLPNTSRIKIDKLRESMITRHKKITDIEFIEVKETEIPLENEHNQ